MNQLTILTCDPSFRGWGYVVIQHPNMVLNAGCIRTEPEHKKRRIRAGDDRTRRISEINSILRDTILKYKVNYIVAELPHGSQNAAAAQVIGMTAGILQTISDFWDIPIEWYSEADAKKCLLGKQSATKWETIQAINKLYDVPWTTIKYKDEAIADAMAIYHVACQQSSTLKLLQS